MTIEDKQGKSPRPLDCPRRGPCGRCLICLFPRTEAAEILGTEGQEYEISRPEKGVGIAIDIGTTTLVITAVDLENGRCILEKKAANPQRIYGADVLSRIQACKEAGVKALQQQLWQEIVPVLRQVLSTGRAIRRMYVCGNSVMEHIFLGIDPQSLGEFPYECPVTEVQVLPVSRLFEGFSEADFPVVVLPNPAAFAGADVAAGIISTDLDRQEGILLVDLGTNGEMALSHGDRIYLTSAAAGPALEGGNMTCGVAGVLGAVSSIRLEEDAVYYETVGGQPAVGICGSGYMEGISELVARGLVDETGYLAHEVEIEGEIRITPTDIRHFQMAKSAVRCGIEVLCRRAQIGFSQIRQVIISGGFGRNANLAALVNVGILPAELVRKTQLAGNTALDGTIRMMLSQDVKRLSLIRERCVYVNLAEEETFVQEYMKYMRF